MTEETGNVNTETITESQGDVGEGSGVSSNNGTSTDQGRHTALTEGNGSDTEQKTSTEIPDWVRTLPSDLQDNQSLRQYKDLPSYIKSALEAEKLIGRKGIIKPPENATEAELEKYYDELGRPEKAESYNFEKPEDWPKDLPFDDTLIPKAQEMFHKRGISLEQAQGLWQDYHELMKESLSSEFSLSESQVEDGIKKLKSEFGGEEKYNAQIELAKQAVNEFGGSDLIDFLDKSGLGNHPVFIRTFAKMGGTLSEDSFTGRATSGGSGLTPQAAKNKIEQIMNDPEQTKIIYSEKLEDQKRKRDLNKELEELYKRAYPTEVV